MKQPWVDVELGLLWRAEQEAFDITLHSTKDEEHRIVTPGAPLRLNADEFAVQAEAGPETYAETLSNRLFAVAEVADFVAGAARLADDDSMPLHLRLLIDPN